MRIRCAWCGTLLGEKEGGPGTTSGICQPCLEAHFPEEASALKKKGANRETDPAPAWRPS